MLDFVAIQTAVQKKKDDGGFAVTVHSVYPEFLVCKSKDLMIRGKSFYAVWDEEAGLWCTDEDRVQQIVDGMTKEVAKELREKKPGETVKPLYLRNYSSKKWTEWQSYVKSLPDNYVELDTKLTFSNTKVKKKDYVSKRLPYPLEEGSTKAYDELMDVLYDPEERKKLEWAIGAIISGDSKEIQKFIVLYGAAGSGKSTVLNIIQDLFDGYYSVFEAKALASMNNAFALEAFKTNPLVAIQHDGDLSRIEDNTKLNSIVSHEVMVVNEKFKSAYSSRFNSFLFMGTNRPVRITDAKSGIIRRLIDVSPSGRKIPFTRYLMLTAEIKFELGAIAHHCLQLYSQMGKSYYDKYKPTTMIGATNDFYNFVEDSYEFFKDTETVGLKVAWRRYRDYCTEANVQYPFSMRVFKEELKNYFKEFSERKGGERNVYTGFLRDKFNYIVEDKEEEPTETWLSFDSAESVFDAICKECLAQYATEDGKPTKPWDKVVTVLSGLDTSKLHYVRIPVNHIVIDFDLKDEHGEKDLEKNIKAASKWPPTYAELSQSGKGIHLHYIYSGDSEMLNRVYAENIEIKVFTGKSSLRRKLTRCNDLEIATISSGLPLKEGGKMVSSKVINNEKALRTIIKKNLLKEYHPGTKPSIDFINKVLDDMYQSGASYDVTDMRPDVLAFAMGSTNHADYCVKLVTQMKFKSEEPSPSIPTGDESPIIFFDVEVFPNLFVIVWKVIGEGNIPVKMINPSPELVERLAKQKLVGFNNRRYDNHILYARMMGYTNEQLFQLSQKIIGSESRNALFSEAYNLSYTDIYDFCSKKQSLKKWEIELGIHHQELGLPWDKPVPTELWKQVADYCVNDVVATEAVFEARREDFVARQVLAELSGLTVNDTTRMHATKIIFGDDKNPPLVYTDLSTIFPGYKFENGHSSYLGEDPSEGGYVYAEPGMYGNVALLDIASLHPHSAIELNIFGPYTQRFKELVDGRLAIKHRDKEAVKNLLGGVLVKYMGSDEEMDALAYALKIVINSVYGFTSATFPNPFRDPRNKDNIVAKRGALFMIQLKQAVQAKGFTVAHVKTDSIKIPDATPEIISFVMEYGKKYGYTFEHEATYDKMCLVNDAVYIAKYKDGKHAGEWTATGAQFAQPYVFKTLFSKEKIEFKDLCETKTVSTALYLDMNENLPEGEHNYHFVGKAGLFTPIKAGCGGGVLYREKDGKYYAAGGTKGYRWLESETVKALGKEDDIDLSYYTAMATAAIEDISKFGDFEWFVSEEPYDGRFAVMPDFMNIPETTKEEIPWD